MLDPFEQRLSCAAGRDQCSDLLGSLAQLLKFSEVTLSLELDRSDGCCSVMEENSTTFSNWSGYVQRLGCRSQMWQISSRRRGVLLNQTFKSEWISLALRIQMETILYSDRQFCIPCAAPYIFLQGEHGSGPRTHVLPSMCDSGSRQSRSHLLPVQASTLHRSTSEVPDRLLGRPGAFPSVVSVVFQRGTWGERRDS